MENTVIAHSDIASSEGFEHPEHPYSWAHVPSEMMSLFSEHIDPAIKHRFMLEAIAEARKSSLHPTVGAVIVRGDKIIGRGHRKVEKLREAPPLWRVTHAEVAALQSVEGNADGATLYATLEPCAGRFQGATVEAAEVCSAVIPQAGIASVVIGLVDRDPMTNGKGLQRLSNQGIRLEYAYQGLEHALIELVGDGQFGVMPLTMPAIIRRWINQRITQRITRWIALNR